MGSEVTLYSGSPYLRGLLLHDERITAGNLDDGTSTYTEAGEEPGQPTPTDVSGFMALEAGGISPTTGYDLGLIATKEGAPVGGNAGGRYRWKRTADGVAEWRGCNAPNKVSGFEFVRHVSSGSGYDQVDSVTTADHDVITVYRNEVSSNVSSSVLSASNDTWAHADVTTDGAFKPAIVQFPTSTSSNRLACIYVRTDLTEGGVSYYTLGLSFSADGSTWTEAGKHLEGFKVSQAFWTLHTIRAVYHGGYITLMLSGDLAATPGRVYHLVSADHGASWTEVETIDSTAYNFQPWVDAAGTVLALWSLRISPTFTVSQLQWGRKATAYSTFAADPTFETALVFGNVTTEGAEFQTAIGVDSEGYLLVASTAVDPLAPYGPLGKVMFGRFDASNLQTARDRWLTASAGGTAWPIDQGAGASDIYLSGLSLTPYKGRTLLLSNCGTPTSTVDDSLGCVRLGGYTSLDWLRQSFGATSTGNRSGYSWLPWETPATLTTPWTTVGAGSEALNSSGMTITTSASIRAYSRPGSTSGTPVIVTARLRVTAGGSLGADEIAIQAARADNTIHYDVSLRANLNAGEQELRLWDNIAGSAVGVDATGLGSDALDVLIALDNNRGAAYYKAPNETLWTLVGSGTLLDGGALSAANNRVEWGHQISAVGTATSQWAYLCSAMDDEAGATNLQNYSNPADLQGRAFSTRPLYLKNGTTIRGTGGSAYTGDTWSLESRSATSAGHVCPDLSPSPSSGWQARDTTEAILSWNLEDGTTPSSLLSSSIGITILGANFQACLLEGWDGATWTTLIQMDSAATIGASLNFDGDGTHIYPNASTPAGIRFLEGGELVGGYAILDYEVGGVPQRSTVQIRQNTGGVWRSRTTARAVELVTRGHNYIGVSTPTGIRILPPMITGIAHGITTDYRRLRLRIPASQDTYLGEGYRIGGICLGPLAVFGRQHSWGTSIGLDPQQEISSLPSGSTRVQTLGAPRRRVDIAWDNWDSTQIYDTDPAPDYLVSRNGVSGVGIATRDNATLLRGLLRRQSGAALPVTYLPKIDQATGAASTYVYSSPARMLYGRITSPTTSTVLIGNDAQNEVISIDAVSILEEPI